MGADFVSKRIRRPPVPKPKAARVTPCGLTGYAFAGRTRW